MSNQTLIEKCLHEIESRRQSLDVAKRHLIRDGGRFRCDYRGLLEQRAALESAQAVLKIVERDGN